MNLRRVSPRSTALSAPAVALRRMRVGAHERLAWYRDQWDAAGWDRAWWASVDRPAALRLLEDCRADYVQVEAMRRHFPRDGLLLEAGCGLGQWMMVLRESGLEVVGADLSSVSLEKARAYFPGLRLVRADVTRLPFPEGSLAGCLSIGVLEHFQEGPGAGLDEVFRVLRPGGVLLCAVPFFNPLRGLVAREGGPPPGLSFYQWAFTTAEFAALLDRHGFRLRETVPFASLKTLRDVAGLSGAAAPPGGEERSRGRNRVAAMARTAIKHRLLNLAPIRRLAGHMMAYAATRREGGGPERC